MCACVCLGVWISPCMREHVYVCCVCGGDHICVPAPCLCESACVSVYVCVNMCVLEGLSVVYVCLPV